MTCIEPLMFLYVQAGLRTALLKDGILLIEDVSQLRTAIEHLYSDREEIYTRGKKLRSYMLGRECRVTDKVNWLEKEIEAAVQKRR